MKKQHVISTVTTFFVATVVTVSLASHSALAATGKIYLSPGSANVQNGNNLTLNLRITPGTGVDSVQATVNFDPAQLQYVGGDVSSSAFPAELQSNQSGGTITIARGIFTGAVSADSLIESFTFKALTGSGSSSVTLSNANAIDHTSGAYTNPAVGNATVGFTTPPATCPTGQTGTPPNCTTPPPTGGGSGGSSGGGSSSGSGGNSGDSGHKSSGGSTEGNKGSGGSPGTEVTPRVGGQSTQFTTAHITATTAVPTQVYLMYGTDAQTLKLNTPVTPFATSHDINLANAGLVPGLTYYYIVVSKDQSGHIAQSAVQSFTTKGLTITIGVYDKNHKPLRNQTVTLHSTPMTGKTDDRGFVTFSDVAPGEHHVIYTQGGKQYDQPVSVVNNVVTQNDTQTAPVQDFSVAYNFAQNTNLTLRNGVVVLVLLVVAVFVFIVIRRQIRGATSGTPYSMQAAVVQGGLGSNTPRPSATLVGQPPATTQEMINRLNSIPDPSRPNPGSTVMPVDNVPITPPTAGQSTPPAPGPVNPKDPPKVG